MSLPILKEEVYQRLREELARGIDTFVPLPGMGGALASDLVREHEARQAKAANIVVRSMADSAREYLERQRCDPQAIEGVRRVATHVQQDLQTLRTIFKFSDGSSLSLDDSVNCALSPPIDWSAPMFPICRMCNVASVLDAATQSVCESCFGRLVSYIWRATPLVQSLVLQHRIDSGTLPKFAPDPELQARAEWAEKAYAAKQAEDLKRAQEVYRQRQQEIAQKMRTQARTPQEQLNAAAELKHQAKKALLNRMYGGTGSSDEAINAQAEVLKAEAAQRARIESELRMFHKFRDFDLSFKPQIDEIP